jgi:hypothetical protein
MWSVAAPIGDFVPNINILSQILPSGTTLDEYLRLSIENAGLFIQKFELIDQRIVTADSGQVLAVMEYQGSVSGRSLRFFAVFGVRDDEAVAATLTVPPQEYMEIQAEVEPYLLTLELLG